MGYWNYITPGIVVDEGVLLDGFDSSAGGVPTGWTFETVTSVSAAILCSVEQSALEGDFSGLFPSQGSSFMRLTAKSPTPGVGEYTEGTASARVKRVFDLSPYDRVSFDVYYDKGTTENFPFSDIVLEVGSSIKTTITDIGSLGLDGPQKDTYNVTLSNFASAPSFSAVTVGIFVSGSPNNDFFGGSSDRIAQIDNLRGYPS
jgi:hypothetical protein